MERRDSNCSIRMAIAPEQEHDLEPAVPIVAYLGPISSYTHQVFTLIQYTRPAWSIGLTDYDLAQTALQCFKSDEYDYKPQTTITGSTLASKFSPLEFCLISRYRRCLRSRSIRRSSTRRRPLREFDKWSSYLHSRAPRRPPRTVP
jgi:hypothetical protein